MEKDAQFSACRKYRYVLWRTWDKSKPYALFIGLNPSTADEYNDDPTIRRCTNYSKGWGYGGLSMVNLFAYIATKPTDMMRASDPIGSNNDYWIATESKNAGVVIAAWGNYGDFQNRSSNILRLLPSIKCLNQNRSGEPTHPLYQSRLLMPTTMRRPDTTRE